MRIARTACDNCKGEDDACGVIVEWTTDNFKGNGRFVTDLCASCRTTMIERLAVTLSSLGFKASE